MCSILRECDLRGEGKRVQGGDLEAEERGGRGCVQVGEGRAVVRARGSAAFRDGDEAGLRCMATLKTRLGEVRKERGLKMREVGYSRGGHAKEGREG